MLFQNKTPCAEKVQWEGKSLQIHTEWATGEALLTAFMKKILTVTRRPLDPERYSQPCRNLLCPLIPELGWLLLLARLHCLLNGSHVGLRLLLHLYVYHLLELKSCQQVPFTTLPF